MSRSPRVVRVEHLEGFSLRLTFSDDLVRELDFTGVLTEGVFAPLEDPEFFALVSIDPASGTVVWPGGIDLDPDVLHGDQAPANGKTARVLKEYRLRPTG